MMKMVYERETIGGSSPVTRFKTTVSSVTDLKVPDFFKVMAVFLTKIYRKTSILIKKEERKVALLWLKKQFWDPAHWPTSATRWAALWNPTSKIMITNQPWERLKSLFKDLWLMTLKKNKQTPPHFTQSNTDRKTCIKEQLERAKTLTLSCLSCHILMKPSLDAVTITWCSGISKLNMSFTLGQKYEYHKRAFLQIVLYCLKLLCRVSWCFNVSSASKLLKECC